LYTRALLLLRRSPCWNKYGATRTTCRDVTQQVEFWLKTIRLSTALSLQRVTAVVSIFPGSGSQTASHPRANYLYK